MKNRNKLTTISINYDNYNAQKRLVGAGGSFNDVISNGFEGTERMTENISKLPMAIQSFWYTSQPKIMFKKIHLECAYRYD